MLRHPTFLLFVRLIVCLGMLFTVSAVFSKGFFEEGEEPLEIQSDTADFQESSGEATHKGHVYVKQGQRYLSADVLIIHRTSDGIIDRITATGQPARFEVKPASQQAPIHGEARTIKYFAEDNKIVLLDQAQLTQEERVIQGPYLTYYLDRRTLSSEAVNGQQTKVILQNKGK